MQRLSPRFLLSSYRPAASRRRWPSPPLAPPPAMAAPSNPPSNNRNSSLGKLFPVITRSMATEENWGETEDLTGDGIDGRDASEATKEEEEDDDSSIDNTFCHDGGVPGLAQLASSTHRDGAIYRGTYHWRKHFRIADRNESKSGPDAIPIKRCNLVGGTCLVHSPSIFWQVFSLKLAKIPVDSGSVQLYGYLAARDDLDPLLNYVVNISRDDPIIVEQGSLIEITGPKRAIDSSSSVLIEYDMRIKAGDDREQDDLQLIDGAGIINELVTSSRPFPIRIHGSHGGAAVDMSQMCMYHAVVATVEVWISQLQADFHLRLGGVSGGFRGDEIRLFDGEVCASQIIRRGAIAVLMDTCLDLKLKTGLGPCRSSYEHCWSFEAMVHGCECREVDVGFAFVCVKVVWSTI